MKTLRFFCILVCLCLTTVCQAKKPHLTTKLPKNVPRDKLLSIASNEKYGLDCLFYGDTELHVITTVLICERTSGQYKKYEPIDEVSLQTSLGYYEDVWSPNKEFLVLPLGRFHGFQIINASQVLKEIDQEPRRFIKVFLDKDRDGKDSGKIENETYLWHSFKKWVSDEAFMFTAGLSYTYIPFIYDIGKKKLYILESHPGVFSAISEQGSLTIEEMLESESNHYNK